MARARISYLSETEKDFVHEKTLEVLTKVGVAYNTPRAIELLEAAGAPVDRERLTARLTWDIIEPALKTVPGTVLLAGRVPRQGLRARRRATDRDKRWDDDAHAR